MIGMLPKELNIDGVDYPINSDFRAALLIMTAYNDPKLSLLNKQLVLLEVIYGDNIPPNKIEAIKQAIWFLDLGLSSTEKEKSNIKTMDYKKDEQLIFSAVNAVYTRDVRAEEYMHWWTFYGLCQAVNNESLIATIAHIRYKKATGQKLENHEQKFYKENVHLIEIQDINYDYETMVEELRASRR